MPWVDGRGWLRQDVSHDKLVEAVCVITSVETRRARDGPRSLTPLAIFLAAYVLQRA
ncbi:hypothetical protein GCM10011366_09510 [Ornithinimicrobium tianjinense]|uniref:Transposase n=1 Tax=Ornithinimicrobium tianjinense TaxID=1195761 RepID=A0A917BIX6_9MICO|nr:hypothetical protein GCM10011366_09510 [Ornithinimicrobium tianjinense]